ILCNVVVVIPKDSMDSLLQEIKYLIQSARKAAVQSVDLLQVVTNFELGRRIVEFEQGGADRAEYGKTLIHDLSQQLTQSLGRGFSKSNLEYMRRFYQSYQSRFPEIAQTLSGQLDKDQSSLTPYQIMSKMNAMSTKFSLSWSHYIFLLYVNYFDRKVKLDDENSTVGIILCMKKNDALVEITLPLESNIHASEYQLYLPNKEELEQKLLEWTANI
ncbi:MAG: PDDEXK nuclease domain-containing protein, partial [Chloroflexota bacterium]